MIENEFDPAVPGEWEDVSHGKLRAGGGCIVSATRRGGKTLKVGLKATVGGFFRITNPFAEESFQGDINPEIPGDELRLDMLAWEFVRLRRGSPS